MIFFVFFIGVYFKFVIEYFGEYIFKNKGILNI